MNTEAVARQLMLIIRFLAGERKEYLPSEMQEVRNFLINLLTSTEEPNSQKQFSQAEVKTEKKWKIPVTSRTITLVHVEIMEVIGHTSWKNFGVEDILISLQKTYTKGLVQRALARLYRCWILEVIDQDTQGNYQYSLSVETLKVLLRYCVEEGSEITQLPDLSEQ